MHAEWQLILVLAALVACIYALSRWGAKPTPRPLVWHPSLLERIPAAYGRQRVELLGVDGSGPWYAVELQGDIESLWLMDYPAALARRTLLRQRHPGLRWRVKAYTLYRLDDCGWADALANGAEAAARMQE